MQDSREGLHRVLDDFQNFKIFRPLHSNATAAASREDAMGLLFGVCRGYRHL